MKIYRLRFVLVVLALALLTGTFWAGGAPAAAEPPTPSANVPLGDGPWVVRAYYTDRAMIGALAAWNEPWEVNREAGYVVVAVGRDGYQRLLDAGFRVEVDVQLTEQMNQLNEPLPGQTEGIPGYPCYRTVEETFATAQTIAADHPNLATWIDVGDTWEKTTAGGEPGYDMMVLRLTNSAVPGPKPKMFVMTSVHAREYTPAELNTRFAEYLVDNYDVDPDVTWLLDYTEIHLMLQANPDGRKIAEQGYYQRKNTNDTNGGNCSVPPTAYNQYGTDLNRNFSFQWGCCGGSSGDPCEQTYRGSYLASEPETQAIQDYVRAQFPDQREDDLSYPAPDDATGIFFDIHSYSELVLWSWGFTSTPAPNSTALQTLGRKLAYFNGYWPEQAMDLYPTDGTTEDFAYGELGLAAYTFELGTAFFQDCSMFENTILPDNLPALIYAAKVARTPYLTPAGPDALDVAAAPDSVLAGLPVHLTATVDDTRYNNQNGSEPTQGILAAEYYVDTPPWDGGVAVSMSAADGSFGGEVEAVEASVPTAGWAPGQHILFVRGQDTLGNWGPVSAVFVETDVDSAVEGHVTDAGTAAPIAGAELLLEGTADAFTSTTGALGYYAVPVFSDVYTVTASAFGYWPEVVGGVVATTGVTTTQDFSLAAMPTGTVAGSVLELGTNLPLTADLVVANSPVSATTGVSGAYDLVLPLGTYTITASAPGHEPRTISKVSVAAGQVTELDFLLRPLPCLLLVDDDYSGSLPHAYEAYYEAALRSLGIHYDTWTVQDDGYPGMADLADYTAVLWFTGDVRYGTLNITEQTALRQYLVEGSGALLLSGQNVAFDIAEDSGDFMSDVLGADFVLDDAGLTDLEGGGLFAGQSLSLVGGDGAGNQDSPDVVTPRAGATSVLTYTGNGSGGVANGTEGYRSLFLSFGLEGVNSAADRQSVLEPGLSWLGCSAVPVDLRIGKQGPSAPVQPGDLLTYTLALTNNSTIPLTGLVISDTLPGELAFVSASPPAVWDGSSVRWSDLTLASEGQLTLSLVAEVRAGVVDGTTIRNADYGAMAIQMSAPVMGQDVVETPVGVSGGRLFLPLILRETSN